MATPSFGSVPFEEQLEFFRRKLNLPTQAWTDIYGAEHDWAFIVAGANRDAIVADFRTAIEKAIRDGTTLEEFRRDFDAIVARHGWDYKGGRNWRSRVIYETNIRSSYAAGRYQQLLALTAVRPYWQYVHSDAVRHPRPHHEALDGLVLRWDDPWWDAHFPPNGWGCQCTVRGLNQRDLERMGKSGPDPTPAVVYEDRVIGRNSPNGPRTVRVPVGVDPGFDHAPGRSRLASAMPPAQEGMAPGLPSDPPPDPPLPPRTVPAGRVLPPGTSDERAVEALLGQFGAIDEPVVFTDAVGERLPIGRDLFAGGLPVPAPELPLVGEALRAPDEIWTRIEWQDDVAEVRRRYLGTVRLGGVGEPRLVVVERGATGWAARILPGSLVDAWRVGVRLFRRGGG